MDADSAFHMGWQDIPSHGTHTHVGKAGRWQHDGGNICSYTYAHKVVHLEPIGELKTRTVYVVRYCLVDTNNHRS